MFKRLREHMRRQEELRRLEQNRELLRAAFRAGFFDGFTSAASGMKYDTWSEHAEYAFLQMYNFLKEDA